MYGTISHEIKVNVAASEAWKVYGTLDLAKIGAELLPNLIAKLDVEEGDGGVGTILKLTFPPGLTFFPYYKEKFTVVDDEKRVKETELIEGGYLDVGFTLYRLRFENIEVGENECITRCTIEYELDAEAAANISLVNIKFFVVSLKAIANYLTRKQERSSAL